MSAARGVARALALSLGLHGAMVVTVGALGIWRPFAPSPVEPLAPLVVDLTGPVGVFPTRASVGAATAASRRTPTGEVAPPSRNASLHGREVPTPPDPPAPLALARSSAPSVAPDIPEFAEGAVVLVPGLDAPAPSAPLLPSATSDATGGDPDALPRGVTEGIGRPHPSLSPGEGGEGVAGRVPGGDDRVAGLLAGSGESPRDSMEASVLGGRAAPASPEYDGYVRALRQRIQERLHYPWLAVRQGAHGVVELEVHVDPEGRLAGVSVRGGVATALLREAALRAVRGATPLPFPPGVEARPLTIRFPVVFELR